MMNINTLYYTLSVIPQVTGTIAAIVGTFTLFRILILKEYLIGDGKSVLLRWGEVGYVLPDDEEDRRQKKRLQDAIERRSISEIKKVILLLRDNEKKEGYSKQNRPTGLQYIYEDRFCGTEVHMTTLNKWILAVIITSFLSIVVSIVSLASTDNILYSSCYELKYIILWLNVILFLAPMVSAFSLLYVCLKDKTVHEIL